MNLGNCSRFQFTKALVSGVPSSLPAAAQRLNDAEPVDFNNAVRQHAEYVDALKKLGLDVIQLPADDAYPDCVFVEDTAVVCDGVALIPRIGHPTRRGETTRVKATLEQLGLKVIEMTEPAELDGGDVLFTGKEFLVGLTKRTNKAGLDVVAKTFPSYPVTGISSVIEHLHLKSIMTMGGPDMLVVGGSEEAESAWAEIQKKAKFPYKKLSVPDSPDVAANCLYINSTLVHLAASEIPKSVQVFQQLPGPKVELENSEFSKVDGCLTCRSILM